MSDENAIETPKAPNKQLAMQLFAQFKAKKEQLENVKKSIESLNEECGMLAERIATEANVKSFKDPSGIEYAVGRVGKSKTYTVKRRSASNCIEFAD